MELMVLSQPLVRNDTLVSMWDSSVLPFESEIAPKGASETLSKTIDVVMDIGHCL